METNSNIQHVYPFNSMFVGLMSFLEKDFISLASTYNYHNFPNGMFGVIVIQKNSMPIMLLFLYSNMSSGCYVIS
jgi:hypothetical protein